MKRFIEYLKRSSLDQKRYYGLGAVLGVVLFIYAISHVSDGAQVHVEQSKNSDFKNGNLTADQTSDFYREKNIRAQNQNERIIQHLKEVDERMAEIAKRFESKDPSGGEVKAVAPTPPPDPAQVAGGKEGDGGKKMIRRGQNQSKIMYPLVMPIAEASLHREQAA